MHFHCGTESLLSRCSEASSLNFVTICVAERWVPSRRLISPSRRPGYESHKKIMTKAKPSLVVKLRANISAQWPGE